MASRYWPTRDTNLAKRFNDELVGNLKDDKCGIIGQEVILYRVSTYETETNMYGESGGGKVYEAGVKLSCIIEAEDFDFEVNESIFKKRSDLDEQEALINDKTTFLTGKILLSKGKKYSCLQAKNEKRELTGKPEPVYDVPEFWKELDHYRLINEL